MSIITAAKLNMSYSAVPVLSDVSFHINKGDRIGVVGANGAGKSTLIKLLAGELQPESGDLFIAKDLSTGYLKQRDHFPDGGTVLEEMDKIFAWQHAAEKELASLTEQMEHLPGDRAEADRLLDRFHSLQEEFENRRGYSYKGEIRGILNSLAFTEDYYDKPVGQLSGGERTRLALAALLLQAPDLLLLDEPTNHLDLGTLKWLEGYLKGSKGTLVIISHDRYFLDKCVTRIFEVERRHLTAYNGNYSDYKEKKQIKYEEDLKHYNQVMEEVARQEEIIRRFKEHNTEHLVKRAQSREKMLEHMDIPEKPVMPNEHLNINFSQNIQSGNDVVRGEDLSKSFGEGAEKRLLFEHVNFDIKRGDRICIVGANGIGKTTLLRIILGKLEADSGIVRYGVNVVPGYYDQGQQELDESRTVLDELHSRYRKYDQTQLRKLLGNFLFHGDDVFKTVRDLSGGEKARLSLLKLMMSGANLLILDEPTNHLDIKAKEVFEDALLDFPGTLIIVSHDRYLLKRIPTAILELNSDGITTFLGNYDYYSEKTAELNSGKSYLNELGRISGSAALREAEENKAKTKEERAAARLAEKQQAAEKRRAERQLEKAEQDVKTAEEEVKRLEAALCDPAVYSDPQKGRQTAQELEEAKAR
ncbi:MAG: ATP-binding cassette domain-containing protein, partial [Firmicutes bacterium]|nr:ATP-binding cassette domain-containing protein [Bacillota bacterium]